MKQFIIFICLVLSFLMSAELHAASFWTIGEEYVYKPEVCRGFNNWSMMEIEKDPNAYAIYCTSLASLYQYSSFKLLVLAEVDRYLMSKHRENVMSASEVQNEMRIAIREVEKEIMQIERQIESRRLQGIFWNIPSTFEFESDVTKFKNAIEMRRQQKDLPKIEVVTEKVQIKAKRKKKK